VPSNRLIFIKFLEERLVRSGLLSTSWNLRGWNLSTVALQVIFRSTVLRCTQRQTRRALRSGVGHRPLRRDSVPNGGLFRPELNSDSDVDERQFEVQVWSSSSSICSNATSSPRTVDPDGYRGASSARFRKRSSLPHDDAGDQNADARDSTERNHVGLTEPLFDRR